MADRQFDTNEMKAIVEEAVEKTLDRRLADRPTRMEVETMIASQITRSIDTLQARIREDRKESMDGLAKMIDGKIGEMNRAFDRFLEQIEIRHQGLQRDVEDVEEQVDKHSETLFKYGQTQTMVMTSVNTLNQAVFGTGQADGPESIYAMIRRMEQAITGLGTHYEPRIAALEQKEAWRSNIEAQVLKTGNFLVSKRGILLIVAVMSFILALLDKGYAVETYIAPIIHAVSGQP